MLCIFYHNLKNEHIEKQLLVVLHFIDNLSLVSGNLVFFLYSIFRGY